MFNNPRYCTRGISSEVPLLTQIILWGLIDSMEVAEKDYLQIFRLSAENGKQKITHSQEGTLVPASRASKVFVETPIRAVNVLCIIFKRADY